MRDIRWLGFDWGDRLYYASDYFEKFYECAVQLIKEGKAYVEDLSADQIREYRGTLTEPGRNSPYRDRSVAENLDLFTRMRAGEFEEGQRILRAKIDMTSGNLNMRDPALYRIKKVSHYRAGDKWCIYPMYDFAHPISDALESVTHSMCSLEFEDHRPLYDWVLDQFVLPSRPVQIEFGRLNIGYTVTTTQAMWKDHPEKVCAFTEDFANRNPKTVKATLKALHLASVELDRMENRAKFAEIIARPAYINTTPAAILERLTGKYVYGDGRVEQDPNYMIFSSRGCNYPQQIYATWWLTQFRRWGMVKTAPDYAGIAKRVMRSDFYIDAMKELGATPKIAEEQKIALFDGAFDGTNPDKYATSFAVHSIA